VIKDIRGVIEILASRLYCHNNKHTLRKISRVDNMWSIVRCDTCNKEYYSVENLIDNDPL